MKLHGYFRSAASWRVRIALGLKGVTATPVSHHLRRGEQRAPAFLAINPQGFVPALELDDGRVITQSMAIIEWLDETHPQPPLLPADAYARARVVRSGRRYASVQVETWQDNRSRLFAQATAHFLMPQS